MKTLFFGGTILTMSDSHPHVDAMLIEDNMIIDLGSRADLDLKHPTIDTQIDLNNQTLLPGFNDSHLHLLGFGESLQLCRLEGSASIKELQKKLADFSQDNEVFWIRGRGWNQDHFDVKELPTAQDLDAIVENKPVVLNRACGHILVCNSKALEIADINSDSVQPGGGQIDFDSNNKPTGILRENAMTLVQKHFPDPTAESLEKAIIAGSNYALTQGITSVQSDDLCVHSQHLSGLILDTFQAMDEGGQLPLRVYEQALFRSPENLKKFIDAGYTTGNGSNFYKEGPLKILADGSLGARTALLTQAYEDSKDEFGIAMYDQPTLDLMVEMAQSNGLSSAIHAIGDGTIDMAIEAIEKAQKKYPDTTLRNSIVHCQITRQEHFEKMRQLNILAHVQPIFIDYDMNIVEARLGASRMKTTYAWKTMIKEDVRLAFGSDCPVEALDIMPNIYSAVTRKNLKGLPAEGWMPHEKLDVMTTLKGFTTWPAYASGEEHIKGRLDIGMLADFTILSDDPTQVDPDDILNLQIVETWVDGKQVYLNPEFK